MNLSNQAIKNDMAILFILCMFYIPEIFNNHDADYIFKVKFLSTLIVFILCIILLNGVRLYLEMSLFAGIIIFQILNQILFVGYDDLLRPNLLLGIFTAFILILMKSNLDYNFNYANEVINRYLNYLSIVYCISVAWRIHSAESVEFFIRVHTLIYLFIFCLIAGIEINKRNLLLFFFTTIMAYLFSYASRIELLFLIILLFLISRKLFLFVTLTVVYFLPQVNEILVGIRDVGVVDFGREYIYGCYVDNFSSAYFFFSNFSVFKPCNDVWGYSHSSHLEVYINLGLLLYIIALLSLLIETVSNIIAKKYSIGFGLMFGIIFGVVEGGVEFIYFTSLVSFLSRCHIMLGRKKQAQLNQRVSE